MDETTKTGQDNPTAAPGGSSSKGGGTTSKDKGKVYTDAEILKIKSDAAAEAGRQRKAAEQERDALKQDLQSATSRLDALERESNESRLAEARGDPHQLRLYQKEEALKKREREADTRDRDLARREAQLKSDQTELDKDRGVVSIAYIAAKHGLETEELESLNISDQETLDKVAEKLAAAKGKGEDADQQAYRALETDAERATFLEAHPDFKPGGDFKPDSGGGTGGGEPTEKQKLKERYPTMDIK